MAGDDTPGVVFIPWYATGFRGDRLELALAEISEASLRYGATEHSVYRSRGDRYRLLQVATFPDQVSWQRYWYGPEFSAFRADHSGWYQIPVVYEWQDLVVHGAVQPASETESQQQAAL